MSGAVVMILRGLPDGRLTGYEGQYLKDFDFEANGGLGLATMTPHLAEAKRFAHLAEAISYRDRRPACAPLRADGLPNRPLTATTWELTSDEACT